MPQYMVLLTDLQCGIGIRSEHDAPVSGWGLLSVVYNADVRKHGGAVGIDSAGLYRCGHDPHPHRIPHLRQDPPREESKLACILTPSFMGRRE